MLSVILLPISLTAQNKQVLLGLVGGINVADVDYSPDAFSSQGVSKKTISGFAGGIGMEWEISRHLHIRSDLIMVLKGNRFENALFQDTTAVDTGTETEKINQLDLPLLLMVSYPIGPVSPYLLAGPSLGLVTDSKAVIEIPGKVIPDQDTRGTTTTFDVGYVVGGGLRLSLLHDVVFTGDFRYQHGFTNVLSVRDSDRSMKTRGLQGILGVLFTL